MLFTWVICLSTNQMARINDGWSWCVNGGCCTPPNFCLALLSFRGDCIKTFKLTQSIVFHFFFDRILYTLESKTPLYCKTPWKVRPSKQKIFISYSVYLAYMFCENILKKIWLWYSYDISLLVAVRRRSVNTQVFSIFNLNHLSLSHLVSRQEEAFFTIKG